MGAGDTETTIYQVSAFSLQTVLLGAHIRYFTSVSQELSNVHFAEEETERLNYLPKVIQPASKKRSQDLNPILLSKHIVDACRQNDTHTHILSSLTSMCVSRNLL